MDMLEGMTSSIIMTKKRTLTHLLLALVMVGIIPFVEWVGVMANM